MLATADESIEKFILVCRFLEWRKEPEYGSKEALMIASGAQSFLSAAAHYSGHMYSLN
jgi:hypothetical protein